jgi:hypothetical protein
MRSALITMAFVACAVPAFAQTADPDDKRFTFYKVAEWFLRLDGRTGAVSMDAPGERLGLHRGAGRAIRT